MSKCPISPFATLFIIDADVGWLEMWPISRKTIQSPSAYVEVPPPHEDKTTIYFQTMGHLGSLLRPRDPFPISIF